jgi:hypothetical protein
MLSTVLKDKEKIEETIEELDRYKRDALQKTWEKVNGYDSHQKKISRELLTNHRHPATLVASLQNFYLAISQSYSLLMDKTSCRG